MSDYSYYYVPDELLTKILLLLPTKSLVRATCVCKTWYSLITSSDFITTHLNQTRASNNNNNTHLILLRYYPGHPGNERHALHFDNDTFDRYDDVEFPIQSSNDYFRVVASCNGLICLSDDNFSIDEIFVLWNPTIRKLLTLPDPEFTYLTHGPFDHAIGCGFDPRTNDYKVVRIVYLQEHQGCSPKVEIYRLSTRSWVTIATTHDPSYFVCYNFCTQALINGAFHWPAYKRDLGALIMSFDLSDEVFCDIRLPASYIDQARLGFVTKIPLAVCGEWLSIFDYQKSYYNKRCSIWVMKEYGVVDSWTKLYTIDLNGGLGKTLGFRRNGEILLVMKSRELVSYNLENQQIKHLGIRDSKKDSRLNDLNSYTFHVDAYVESLVLIGDANRFRTARACDAREEKKEKQMPAYWIGLGCTLGMLFITKVILQRIKEVLQSVLRKRM